MANTATVVYNPYQFYEIRVNGTFVHARASSAEATAIVDRLNRIFADTNRDLDFIIPTNVNGTYAVCCPLVRKNVGQTTYFANGNSYPAKLYEASNWNDTLSSSTQTAILSVPGTSTTPWLDALRIANNIRSAISLNFNDAAGNTSCKALIEPSNTLSTIAGTISSSAYLEFYGEQCQGSTTDSSVYCPHVGFNVAKIYSALTYNGEVFHPQDLTAAMTSTNNWHSTYKNKYVKVTNLSDTSKSIVVKVVDQAPANKGIELSHRAYVAIGSPGSGSGKVKIELLAT